MRDGVELERTAKLEELAARIEEIDRRSDIEKGRCLAEARNLFAYDRNEGGFRGWVETRLLLSRATAYRWIGAYERSLTPIESVSRRDTLRSADRVQTAELDDDACRRMMVEVQPEVTAHLSRLGETVRSSAEYYAAKPDRLVAESGGAQELARIKEHFGRPATELKENAKFQFEDRSRIATDAQLDEADRAQAEVEAFAQELAAILRNLDCAALTRFHELYGKLLKVKMPELLWAALDAELDLLESSPRSQLAIVAPHASC